MLNKRLAIVPIAVLAIAVPSIAFGAGPATPTAKPAPATKVGTPTVYKSSVVAKPTQEANIKKFKTAPDSAVVAVVNGRKITKGELTNVLYDWMAPLSLDEYVNYVVVQQAEKKEGVTVTDADINAKINEIKKQQVPPGETLEGVLQRMKWPMVRFRAYVATQVGIEKIADKRVQPTAQDYAQYVKASHILIKTIGVTGPDGKAADKTQVEADAKAKIEKIAAEIKAGKSFTQAATEYSEDTGTKDKGGELGWFRKGDMVPEFSDTAFKLESGQVSEPVKTFYGYHLILVQSQGKNATAADKAELRSKIVESQRVNIMRQLGDQLKVEASVVNYISPKLPDAQTPNMSRGPQNMPARKPAAGTAKPAPSTPDGSQN